MICWKLCYFYLCINTSIFNVFKLRIETVKWLDVGDIAYNYFPVPSNGVGSELKHIFVTCILLLFFSFFQISSRARSNIHPSISISIFSFNFSVYFSTSFLIFTKLFWHFHQECHCHCQASLSLPLHHHCQDGCN